MDASAGVCAVVVVAAGVVTVAVPAVETLPIALWRKQEKMRLFEN